MRTAVQIYFNGNGDAVVADVPAALRHVEANLNGPRGTEPFAESYPMLAAAGIEIGLAHRLAQATASEGRESIDLVVHDLDARPGHDTVVSRYDLADHNDPCAIVAIALMYAEDTEVDLSEIEEQLSEDVSTAVRSLVSELGVGPERALERLKSMRGEFGGGTSAGALIDFEGLVADRDLPANVARRAVDAFDAAATLAFTDEAAPTPN